MAATPASLIFGDMAMNRPSLTSDPTSLREAIRRAGRRLRLARILLWTAVMIVPAYLALPILCWDVAHFRGYGRYETVDTLRFLGFAAFAAGWIALPLI